MCVDVKWHVKCLDQLVQLTGKLSCPTCRTDCTSYSVDVAAIVAKGKRKRALAERNAELRDGAFVVSYLAGIRVTDGEVEYKVVWRTAGVRVGAQSTSWLHRSEVDRDNVQQFHNRYLIHVVGSVYWSDDTQYEFDAPRLARDASGKRIFACPHCDKKSDKESNLRDHITGVHCKSPFMRCTVEGCVVSCSTKTNLKTHLKNAHNLE
ncbi:MAG: hypothetical protein P4L81_02005 [Candidatus Pacebacteria bacterium]|nr:hypothetical protein [Candidatus Paceibacterota bacterium]